MQLKMLLMINEVCGWFRWNSDRKFDSSLEFMLRVTSWNGAFFSLRKKIKITVYFPFQKLLHPNNLQLLWKISAKFQGLWVFRFKDIFVLVRPTWFVPLDCATDPSYIPVLKLIDWPSSKYCKYTCVLLVRRVCARHSTPTVLAALVLEGCCIFSCWELNRNITRNWNFNLEARLSFHNVFFHSNFFRVVTVGQQHNIQQWQPFL